MPNKIKPVVFFAFANDKEDGNRYLRLLNHEADQLRKLWDAAGDSFELVMRQESSLDAIFDVFQDPRYRHRIAIFHVGGHANSYQLLLKSAQGKPELADGAGLAGFLGQQRGLALVFLNGCETGGHGQGLLETGIPAVIATDQKIRDDVAVDFAVRFYQALISDQPLQSALAEAEGVMQTKLGHDRTKAYRDASFDGGDAETVGWPWRLHPVDNLPERVATWTLSQAADDCLFGLPPLPPRPLPPRPFLGLSYFHEKDAEIFFGRSCQIRDLFRLITDESLAANPIILLYGQSGVGKSSLLAAGLLPRLKQVAAVRYVHRGEADNNLTAALRQALGAKPSPNPSQREGDSIASPPLEEIEGGPEGASNFTDLWRTQETEEKPLVIILDQVEEIYTRPGPNPTQEMADFLDGLQTIYGDNLDRWPRGKLILSFRKEWLAEIRDRLSQRELPYIEMFLKHLDRPGIIEAITGPAITPRLRAQYNLVIAEEEAGEAQVPVVIADNLLADRGSPIAPTLQIILTKLWDNATGRPKVFSQELYNKLRLKQANFLGQLLDQQLGELAEVHRVESKSGLILDLLAYHTTEVGPVVDLSGPVNWGDLSSDEAGIYFSVYYTNDEAEVWRIDAGPYPLISAKSLSNTFFAAEQQRMISAYYDGNSYLVDLGWLETMGDYRRPRTGDDLMNVACLPFAKEKGFFTADDEARLIKKYLQPLGIEELQSCPEGLVNLQAQNKTFNHLIGGKNGVIKQTGHVPGV